MSLVPGADVPELEAAPLKLVRLKEGELNEYHQRRADKHGYIYYGLRWFGADYMTGQRGALIEAKSLATGAVVTLYSLYVEEQADG